MFGHTCTHTSFILHIGVCAFLWLPSTHYSIVYFEVFCCAYENPSSPKLCFAAHILTPISLPLSPILSKTLQWDFTVLPVDFIVASILNSMLWRSTNTVYDGKDISWHQRAELCYPLSSCIHFCSCHAQTLFVLLFIGMYLTVWQCCVCEQSRVCEQSLLCSSKQLTLVYRTEGGKSVLLSLLLN